MDYERKETAVMKKRILSFVLMLAVVVSTAVVPAAANVEASGVCGEHLTWVLDDDGVLTISGTGDMTDYASIDFYKIPWYSKRSSIKKVIIEEDVTSIGANVFCACSNLTSVEIPDGVTRIGYYAFSGCSSLTSIDIPSSVTSIGYNAFGYCSSLTSITVPNGVKTITYSAFYNCSSLTSIDIPSSVTFIDMYAFYGCSSLTDVYYSSSEEKWATININIINEPLTKATIHYNSTIRVFYDDKRMSFDQDPVEVDGRVLVPMRAIFEAMGAEVTWYDETQTVVAKQDNIRVTMAIGRTSLLYTDGDTEKTIGLDVAPQLINDYTMVPVRAVAEAFLAEVEWNDNKQAVYITSNEVERAALVIANTDFNSAETAAAFKTSASNAVDAFGALGVEDIEYHTCEAMLTDATFTNLLTRYFSEKDDNDISFIYYSGHSYYTEEDEDGNIGGFTTGLYNAYGGVVSFGAFYDIVRNNVQGRVVIFYDGCFAGTMIDEANLTERIKIIGSSASGEETKDYYVNRLNSTFELAQLVQSGERCSLFSLALYNAAINKSDTDSNENDKITFSELTTYIENDVADMADRADSYFKVSYDDVYSEVVCYPANDSIVLFDLSDD